MRALVGAAHVERAARFYKGDFANSLLYSIGAYHTIIELLQPLLPMTAVRPLFADLRSYVMNSMAIAWMRLGQVETAISIYRDMVQVDFEGRNWVALGT